MEVKGLGGREVTKVIITSNIDPANWYSSMAAHGRNTPERIASLLRRLTWIHNPQSRAECSAIPIPPVALDDPGFEAWASQFCWLESAFHSSQ